MQKTNLSRRALLAAGATGLAAATPILGSSRVAAAAPEVAKVSPELIASAIKEGKVVWYTSTDLPVAEGVSKVFEAKYPGVKVRVERSGSERIFQRIGQEYSSNIHAVDFCTSSDASHVLVWKRDGILLPYVTEDIAKFYPAEHRDPDGQFATWRVTLSSIGYNTKLVKSEDAPKSFADLLDPNWAGKMVKAHPGYSGTILTSTFQMARDIGWEYLEKLSKQRVLQVQSASDPSKKLLIGERAIAVDGGEYNLILMKEAGSPIEIVYPPEGSPLIVGPGCVFKDAPNPNAARLFAQFMFSQECQQNNVNVGGLRSVHTQVKDKPGRTPLSAIKIMKDDPAAVEKQAEEIKTKYVSYFKV